MRNRWIWAAAAAAAGWALWFAAQAGPAVEPPIWTEAPWSSPDPGVAVLDGEASTQPVERVADGVFWRLRVLDGDGQPALGARLFADDGERALAADAALATVDDQGRAVVRDEHLGERGLVVAAPGHRSRSVDLAGRDPEVVHVVQLVTGAALSFDVTGPDGEPAASVAFVISHAALAGHGPFPADLVPGGDPAQAMHVATTDEAGRLRFTGLREAAYEIRPADPLHMLLGGSSYHEAPSHGTLRVGEVHGLAVRFDDEVLAESVSYRGGTVSIRQFKTGVDTAERLLAERFPGAICRAAWAHTSVHENGGTASLEVFTRHGGWRSLEVPLRPVSEITEPLEIAVEKGEDLSCRVELRLEQEDGTPIDRPVLFAYAGEHAEYRGLRRLLWPGVHALPAGAWRPMPVDGFLMQALGPVPVVTFEPGASTRFSMSVPGRFRLARLSLEGPGIAASDDDSYAGLALLDARGKHVQMLPYVPLANRLVPLPVGVPSTLLVRRQGYDECRVDLAVPPGEGEYEIVFDLRPEPVVASR